MSIETWTVRYAGLEVTLVGPQWLRETLDRDLGPFFAFETGASSEPLMKVELLEEPAPAPYHRADSDGVEVQVDTSLYAHLASTGTRWQLEEGHLVRIDATGSLFEFQPERRAGRAWQEDGKRLALDTTRMLRGLFTQAVERAGGVQLHSAGVVVDGTGVLVVGDMWQGKTTLLLQLLSEFRVDQLSCDTVVVQADGEHLQASGWPSPFSVNHGTLSDHPELGQCFPEDRRSTPYAVLWKERRKSVLTSQMVVDAFGVSLVPRVDRVASVIVVHFAPESPTAIRPMDDPAELFEQLRPCYLGSRDPIYHDWHDCIRVSEADLDRNLEIVARRMLSESEVYEMTWAPAATSLFKCVPLLARAHPHLSRILG